MKTKELIQHIATSTSMTKTHAEELLNATVAVLQKNLLNGKQANRTRHKKTEQQTSCSVAFLKESEYQK